MSNDLYYVAGDNYFLDDISGFKRRTARDLRLQWDNVATSGHSWSPRQPQDLVQAVRDEQIVALARPRQPNQFVLVGAAVAAFAAAGSNSFTVDSATGFSPGNLVQVMLDRGDPFQFTLAAVTGNVLSWAGAGLPGSVGGNLGDPLENQVLNLSVPDSVTLPQ